MTGFVTKATRKSFCILVCYKYVCYEALEDSFTL